MSRRLPSWAIQSNIGRDPLEMAARMERERMSAAFDADARIAELRATVNSRGASNQSPGVVVRGSEADVNDEFSFVDPGWSEADKQLAASKRIREARAYGNLQRAGTVVDENHVMIGPKVRDKYELEALKQKVFCTNCGDARLDTRHEREERHRVLAEVFGPAPLDGLDPVDDRCGTCGTEFGFREKRIVA